MYWKYANEHPPALAHQQQLVHAPGADRQSDGAALVLLLATLAYLSLNHELDNLARKSLRSKLEQIQHSLLSDLKSSDLAARPHSLLDLVMGHDSLQLSVLGSAPQTEPLLDVGGIGQQPLPDTLKKATGSAYLNGTIAVAGSYSAHRKPCHCAMANRYG